MRPWGSEPCLLPPPPQLPELHPAPYQWVQAARQGRGGQLGLISGGQESEDGGVPQAL